MSGPIAGAISRLGHRYKVPALPAIGTTSARTTGLAIAAGIACVPLLLLMLGPWLLTGRAVVEFELVDRLYYSVAERVSQGQVPYRDFPLEYPVGSLPQLLLPFLAGRDVPTYRAAYAALMLLAWTAAGPRTGRVRRAAREGVGLLSTPPGLVPRLCYLFLCRLIVSNLDVVPPLLAFVAAAANWFAGRPILGARLAATVAWVKRVPRGFGDPAGGPARARPPGHLAAAARLRSRSPARSRWAWRCGTCSRARGCRPPSATTRIAGWRSSRCMRACSRSRAG